MLAQPYAMLSKTFFHSLDKFYCFQFSLIQRKNQSMNYMMQQHLFSYFVKKLVKKNIHIIHSVNLHLDGPVVPDEHIFIAISAPASTLIGLKMNNKDF